MSFYIGRNDFPILVLRQLHISLEHHEVASISMNVLLKIC